MTAQIRLLHRLPHAYRDRLLALAKEVAFEEDTRIFEEGQRADRFWIIRTGTVTLDLRVSERTRLPIDPLGPGDLLGWSWLFPPYQWDFGAEAFSPVRAYEFDAAAVRGLCDIEPALGVALLHGVAEVMANRLESARVKLVEAHRIHHHI
ncbi:cyclic nucleotide-binding domain-containing protein [Streptomyces beihaiensis]|uniref:Cyclic nucleotide-binding domain-containing protein n=1 Tax=Streptomyces beihaiensis TaxID=2984495 RepID=A0ABT3TTX1_9ACTN|nr:cyclic nucleotide-binding domain-containing protein [Streptomyces beihaiensis]MCX3059892.1 cyclic nucleotide-binding domain-containing protein [Streptomyces beihaiensis]